MSLFHDAGFKLGQSLGRKVLDDYKNGYREKEKPDNWDPRKSPIFGPALKEKEKQKKKGALDFD